MKLHIYSHGIELENYPVTLDEAFELLEKQSSKDNVEDNFIGFTLDANDQALLQFIRIDMKVWILDIPTYENHKYKGALSSDIHHNQVFSVTRDFFDKTSILRNSISNHDYDVTIDYLQTRYGITSKLEVS